jgi:hypothetical protein
MRTQMMQFRCTNEEKDLIEKCARKIGTDVANYIRMSLLISMVMDGELQALKIIGQRLGMKAMDALSRRLKENPALQ